MRIHKLLTSDITYFSIFIYQMKTEIPLLLLCDKLSHQSQSYTFSLVRPNLIISKVSLVDLRKVWEL